MPAPKKPNTAKATETVIRKGQETMAAKLREAGWEVTPPYAATRSDGYEYQVEIQLGDGRWTVDDSRVWYSLAGAELRIREMEGRGLTARLT